ncbi:hypothetical protein Leryth_027231 [Lithospermum erythrorhizon]|nr:hypothetical protein Leryth_027231 [Lithospermum erythrorhizon]
MGALDRTSLVQPFYFTKLILNIWFHSLTLMFTSRKTIAEIDDTSKNSIRSSSSTDSKDDMVELRRVFSMFDKNNDGFITKQELKESLKNIGMFVAQNDVEEMVAKVDANGDGLIDFDEFCELYGSVVKRDRGRNEDFK